MADTTPVQAPATAAQISAAPAGQVPVFSPDGTLGYMPPDQFDLGARVQGYRLASPDDVAQWQAEQKYGGAAEGLKSFGEGALSALTFGAGPKIEEAFGAKPEDIAGRKEAHPIAHGAGAVAGVALPLLLTGGASAPASAAATGVEGVEAAAGAARAAPGIMDALRGAAEFSAPSLIAKTGRAVRAGVEGAGLTGAVARYAPVVAQGAIEGGLYSGADVMERTALKDPTLTAEGAAYELGLGSLFGGSFMGIGKAAGEGFSALLGKASKGLQSLGERLATGDKATVRLMMENRGTVTALEDAIPGAADHLQAASPATAEWMIKNATAIRKAEEGFPGLTELLSRADPETGQTVLDNWGHLLTDPDARIVVGRAQGEALQSTYSTVEDALRTANREVRPEEIGRLLGERTPAPKLISDLPLTDITPGNIMEAQRWLSEGRPALGEGYPPIIVAPSERAAGQYEIQDGFHRTARAIQEGRPSIKAVVATPADLEAAVGSGEPGEKAWIRSVMEGSNDAQAGAVDAQAARKQFLAIHDKVDALAKTMRAEPELYSQGTARELEMIREGMWRDYSATISPDEAFNLLNRTKQVVDEQARFGKLIPPEMRRTANAVKGLRTEIKQALEDPKIWGEAGSRQAAFNSAQSEYFTARVELQKSLMQKAVTPTGAVTYQVAPTKVNSWVNLMADARGQAKSQVFDRYVSAAKKLAGEMERSGLADAPAVRQLVDSAAAQSNQIRQQASVTQLVKMLQGHEILSSGPAIPNIGGELAREAIHRAGSHVLPFGLTGILTGIAERVRSPGVTIGVLNALDKMAQRTSRAIGGRVGQIFESEAAAGAKSAARAVTPETYPNVSADLHHYGSDLDRLASTVAQHTQGVATHAPATADALSALAARGVQHLQGLVPAGPAPLPLSPNHRPSVAELTPLNRAHEIATNPLRVLHHIARGTLDPAHVRAAETIWPKLTQEMRTQIMDRLATQKAAGKSVPRRSRLALSMFLGTDLDRSTTQLAIAANQSALAAAPKPQTPGAIGGPGGKGGGKAGAIKSAKTFATTSQRMEGRDTA